MTNNSWLVTEGKAWIKRKNAPGEIVRVIPDAENNSKVTAYLLYTAWSGGPGRLATAAKREDVARVIYLGGLGDESVSKHLQSRHDTARALAAAGPPLTYFRAAMVVGSESESYRTLRYLVKRLPLMVTPRWSMKSPTLPERRPPPRPGASQRSRS